MLLSRYSINPFWWIMLLHPGDSRMFIFVQCIAKTKPLQFFRGQRQKSNARLCYALCHELSSIVCYQIARNSEHQGVYQTLFTGERTLTHRG
jgi:hypothetical protein